MRTTPNGGGGMVASLRDYIRRIRMALWKASDDSNFGEECPEAEWNEDADEEISVALFYDDRKSAENVRVYAEYAIAEAFGDEYRVNVFVAEKIPDDINTFGGFIDHVEANYDGPKADAYHAVYEGGDALGGGNKSVAPHHGQLRDVPTECLDIHGGGGGSWQYRMAVQLHEIGHALGMQHRKSGDAKIDGAIPAMGAGYMGDSYLVLKYCDESIKESRYK